MVKSKGNVGTGRGVSWVNPIGQQFSDEDDERSDSDGVEGFVPVKLRNPMLTDAAVDNDGDAEQGQPKTKRTASAKTDHEAQLSPTSIAARNYNRSKIATFTQQVEFGEVTVDELDMDPDLEAHMQEWCGLKHPRTKTSLVYDLVQFVLLLYIVVWVPWRIAFELETKSDEFIFWWDIFVDCALIVDMFLCMNRYYFDEAMHKLITDPEVIRSQYLRGWFFVDLCSVIPLDVIVRYAIGYIGTEESLARSGKFVRLLRLARFAKIARLAKLASLRKHSKAIKNKIRELGVGHQGTEFVARVLLLTASIYLILHVVGCLWIFQARMLCKDGLFPTWYAMEYRDIVGIDFDNSSDVDDTELQRSPFLGMDPQGLATHPENVRVYIDGIYYVLVTMGQVGYGEILPLSSEERVTCSTTIIAGAFVWAYIIGTFDSALAMMDRDKATFDEWMRQIKAMLRYYNIPALLEFKIDSYFDFKYESKTLFKDDDVIAMLPDRLRRDLQLHRFREIIKRIPFFVDLHDQVIVEIVEQMVGFAVLPGDYVFHKGDPYTELILLKKGRLAVVAEHSKSSQPEWGTEEYDKQIYAADTMQAEYYPGAFFGESQFLGFDQERDVSIRARTFCECFSLHPEDMEPVLRVNPKLKRRLTQYSKMKKQIEQRMSEDLWLEEMKKKLHNAADSSGGWRVLFESMDTDQSGELDSGEFRRAIRAAGVGEEDIDDTSVRRIFMTIDRDESGTVELEEMLEVLTDDVLDGDDPITKILILHKEMEAQMAGEKHELRRVFDQHAVEGHIVKDELAAMCVDLGRPMNQVWELEAAWRSMDPDELGWVEFEAFLDWFLLTDGKVQAVRSRQELWRRTTEQFQAAALAEQTEMSRRIKYLDRRLQQHVREWADIMDQFRTKYGDGPRDQAEAPMHTKTPKRKSKKRS